MKPWMMAGPAALALFLTTTAIPADVTPEEVWANWKSLAQGYGQTITADSETREGDTLVIKGIGLAVDQGVATAEGKIGEIRLKDLGDGTVQITASDSYGFDFTAPPAAGQDAAKLGLAVAMPGMSAIASGTAEAMSFALTLPEMKVHLEGSDAADAAKGAIGMDLGMTGTSGTYAVTKADQGHKVDYQIATKAMDVAATIKDPSQGTDVALKLNLADLATTSSGMVLGQDAMQDLGAALKAGMAMQTDMTHGAGSYELNVLTEGQPAKVSGTIGSGSFGFGMDKTALRLATSSKDVTMAVESAMIPIEGLSGSYGEAAFNLLVPLEKADTPADFKLGVRLVDLSLSDAIWGLIDPGAALPHDPATLILDTKGKATVKADISDPAAIGTMAQDMPADLNALDLDALDLKIAGAELTGQGALTFDNTQTSVMGTPAPLGKIELKATGVNGLLDKLVAMGLMPQDQMMQAKMMLGMFAKPGEGEDTLVSTIEFKDHMMSINGMDMPMQ